MSKNPADYLVGDDATIEDANLDELNITYQGEKLTEARALELGEIAAREAEQSRAARTAGLIPGGKSLSGGRKHSPVVQVRVSGVCQLNGVTRCCGVTFGLGSVVQGRRSRTR